RERAGGGHQFETAAQRVVVQSLGPIDSHRRVDGSLDVFGVDVALLRPAEIGRVGTGGVSLADDGSALDSAAGEEGELLRPVIAASRGGKRAYGAAKLAHHYDQGVGNQAGALEIVQQ